MTRLDSAAATASSIFPAYGPPAGPPAPPAPTVLRAGAQLPALPPLDGTTYAVLGEPHWRSIHETTCPRGHHIPRRFIPLPAGVIQCNHAIRGGRCGGWIFVVAVGAADLAFVIGITEPVARELGRRDLAPLHTLQWLGVAHQQPDGSYSISPPLPLTAGLPRRSGAGA